MGGCHPGVIAAAVAVAAVGVAGWFTYKHYQNKKAGRMADIAQNPHLDGEDTIPLQNVYGGADDTNSKADDSYAGYN